MRRSLLLLVALCVLSFLSLQADSAPIKGKKDNTPPAGFKALFNGKNLDGWQGVVPIKERAKLSAEELAKEIKEANKKVLSHWTVTKDGVLEYDGKADNLQTVKDYGDFELYL